jgi:hypothetical protein
MGLTSRILALMIGAALKSDLKKYREHLNRVEAELVATRDSLDRLTALIDPPLPRVEIREASNGTD